ncbi:MAG: nitrilase-related carbon-nitrogen hydrolase [Dethiobacteria bacterium]|jgi:predicted amidohydrolase|nr:nitrilase-related carbon-nitrogen hydrolase [Bacillota bacterium]NMD33835.1 hypothetical protein [Bacillota bacterium]HOB28227.1 nitrilase-related carbon-nitrogen hydrolase [Bacillota bacterium]HPZ40834.1 nitrilase-related carbon-nitrogen hydrolase [Bacillota bacterium]HQD51793.1 nitrilase-related carbon-nitrogen hydrolase [Bacillota bacterium]
MTKVAAFSLAGIRMEQPGDYAADLTALFKELQLDLAVLPAHTSFLLCVASGRLGEALDFSDSFKLFIRKSKEWNREFLQLHSELARANELYLVAGTTVEEEADRFYHTAYCFGPDGEICGRQRQTHLSREERAFGLSRGEELPLFELAGMKTGLIVGTDARHPEVGRIFALQGAGLVAHAGAIIAGPACKTQPAGIWAQVQQNQFWAVEAQLKRTLGGRSFGAQCTVIGPCEITPGFTGYLACETAKTPFAAAELSEPERLRIKSDYPLLELLNPRAYRGRLPELYR